METIKLTVYGSNKVGDSINVPMKNDRNRTKKAKIVKFGLWGDRYEGLVFYPAYKEGKYNSFMAIENLIRLNPEIEITETTVQPKLYKAIGKTQWGEEEFYQWIAEYEGDEIAISRLFNYITTTDGKVTEWYQNNNHERLPRATRQEVTNS